MWDGRRIFRGRGFARGRLPPGAETIQRDFSTSPEPPQTDVIPEPVHTEEGDQQPDPSPGLRDSQSVSDTAVETPAVKVAVVGIGRGRGFIRFGRPTISSPSTGTTNVTLSTPSTGAVNVGARIPSTPAVHVAPSTPSIPAPSAPDTEPVNVGPSVPVTQAENAAAGAPDTEPVNVGHSAPVTQAENVAPCAPVTQAVEVAPSALVTEAEKVVPTRIGTKGKGVELATNFLRINVEPNKGLFEYRVDFDPVIDSTKIKRSVIRNMPQFGPTRNFDGEKLVLPSRLESDDFKYTADLPTSTTGAVVTVHVKFAKKARERDTIQTYNVLIRRVMELLKLKEINRSFFDPASKQLIKEHKLEIWSGYQTAVDEYEGGLMVCIETAHRVLQDRTVGEEIKALKITNPKDWQEKLTESMIGRSVLTRYNSTFYKIDDIIFDATPKSTFLKKTQEISFVDYYKIHHGQVITDLTQPLLKSRPKPKKNDPRGEGESVLLVPELCSITGLTDAITSNFMIMKTLIQRTRITPIQRVKHMKDFVDRLNACKEAMELLQSWGLSLEVSPVRLRGRVVPAPKIQFNQKCTRDGPTEAEFAKQSTAGSCFRPVNFGQWIILTTPGDAPKEQKMKEAMKNVCPLLGIKYTDPKTIIVKGSGVGQRVNGRDYTQTLKENVKQNEVQFVIVILPQARDELYAAVKKFCLLQTSIPSQVILSKTLGNEKRLRSIIQKVVLQINCKLGGALWALQIPLKEKIMFVGIDVYHDPKRKQKSIMAMVASMDTQCTKHYSTAVAIAPHQEIGDNTNTMFSCCLHAYFQYNNSYPDRIVVFRDGVGDGDMGTVRAHELEGMRRAINLLDIVKLKFTFVVTQKRINERVFKISGADFNNPEPGTVVDHTITRKGAYDFFLISQLVREGTVGPTHYTVLDDSDENKPDLVQRFAFALTYMYYNWAGTVKVPSVCQYAHKLAQLVGKHLLEIPRRDMDTKLYYL